MRTEINDSGNDIQVNLMCKMSVKYLFFHTIQNSLYLDLSVCNLASHVR